MRILANGSFVAMLAICSTVHAENIRDIDVRGSSVYPDDEFGQVMSSFIGQAIDLDVLGRIEEAAADTYLQDGLLVRAFLPEQAFIDGQVVVQIIEAALGEIRFDFPTDLRFSAARVEQFVEDKLRGQFPVNTGLVEQTLNAIDAIPGIANTMDLSASDVVDGTDIDVRAFNTGLTEGVLQADNLGSPSTGEARAYISLQSNSLLKKGEKLIFSHLQTTGTKDTTLQSDWLLGLKGDVVKVGLQRTSYDDSVASNGGPVSVTGTSNNRYLRLSTRELDLGPLKLTPEISIQRNHARDYIGNSLVGDKMVDATKLSATTELYSDAIQTNFALTLSATRGALDLGRLPSALQNDQLTAQRDGRFSKFELDLSITKSLSSIDALNVSISGQTASKNLDGTQSLTFSGSDAVRGYQAGSVSGDEGLLLRGEYSRVLSTELSIFGFADAGLVTTHHSPWSGWDVGSPGLKNHNSLYALGLGARWVPIQNYLISMQLARRVGHVPVGISSPDTHQGWLTMTRTF